MTAQEIVDCFKASFIFTFFPKLNNPEGDEYLLALAAYVLQCGKGKHISENCPDELCCFAIHYIGWLLSTWAAVDVDDDGNIVIDDPAVTQPAVYLKRKTIGGKTCEWDVLDVSKSCSKCPPSSMDYWFDLWNNVLDCCTKPVIFLGGGSWRPEKTKCAPCCGEW